LELPSYRNAAIQARLRKVAAKSSYVLPVLCTPAELTGNYMSNEPKEMKLNQSGDVVLQEIWRVKDTLSASYGHDVDQLFASARERQKLSGHPVVNLQTQHRKSKL
jgi:hypothetical protein